jgi:hypothetical protein
VNWLGHLFGLDDASGPFYLFVSGAGSIIIPPVLTAVPIMLVLLRRHNCQQPWCPRMGRSLTAGGHFVCHRHHPDGPPTAEGILAAHRRAGAP